MSGAARIEAPRYLGSGIGCCSQRGVQLELNVHVEPGGQFIAAH